MSSNELRRKFIEFFKSKGHMPVPSSSLIPDDPSVLLTTAGMQQFVPYFTGEADPEKDFHSRRVMSVQKSFRAVDIDEVGDESHLTFFEMLGHFSFGDYFKKETIEWTHEFLAEVLKISLDRVSVTVFEGDDKIPFDQGSHDAWKQFLPEERIKKGPRKDNVWGPVSAEGICGAANEVYIDGMEVATLVFPEYYCHKDKSLTPLAQKGVDVGWGMERVAMIAQGKKNVFETDLFAAVLSALPADMPDSVRRIISDHSRAVSFLISDGVRPSNKGAGYILRRLLRRMIVHEKDLQKVFAKIHEIYSGNYSEFDLSAIEKEYSKENEKFQKTLDAGLRELKKLKKIDATDAFNLYQTYGLPFEIVKDLAGDRSQRLRYEDFDREFAKHQEISRAGLEKKFGGHGLLLDTGELKAVDEAELKIVTRLHTATHLLQAALRKVLGPEVRQNGSDITARRTRFDFTFGRKLTDKEKKKVEDLVNQKIQEDLPVAYKELPIEEAKKTGALYFFKAKYGDKVKVYYVGNDFDSAFSKEFCGGPHVFHTAEIGHFKILKEESASAGVRRIRAVVV